MSHPELILNVVQGSANHLAILIHKLFFQPATSSPPITAEGVALCPIGYAICWRVHP